MCGELRYKMPILCLFILGIFLLIKAYIIQLGKTNYAGIIRRKIDKQRTGILYISVIKAYIKRIMQVL